MLPSAISNSLYKQPLFLKSTENCSIEELITQCLAVWVFLLPLPTSLFFFASSTSYKALTLEVDRSRSKKLVFSLLLGIFRDGNRVSPLNPKLSQTACFPDIGNIIITTIILCCF